MTHNHLKQSLEQFILRLQTDYRYGLNEHITFNTDVINSLRFTDLTHDIEQLLQPDNSCCHGFCNEVKCHPRIRKARGFWQALTLQWGI